MHVAAGSPLHRLTGRRRLHVNSFHHQAVDRLGAGLEVIARAPDGTVEALHDPAARFHLGVQWHAELLTHRAEHAPVVAAPDRRRRGRPALAPRRLERDLLADALHVAGSSAAAPISGARLARAYTS